jgi:LysR family transcriptional regulator, hydrogen peroxide-inducible genes activator
MLTLRQLQYFVALAELRHFGKAAEKCCVTQPALSMQMKELEEALGMQLIERRRGNLELTAEGREIAGRAHVVLNTVRDLEDYARHRSQTLVGDLRLGVIPSVAPYLLPKILPEVRARYPELQLKLHERLTQSLVAELIDGSLDAIILALPVPDSRAEAMQLFDDRFLLARPRASRGVKKRRISLASLKNEKLLLLNDGHCLRDQALSYCHSIARDMLSEFGASSLSTIMKMVANGYGVTLLPEIAAASELADSRIELLHFAPPEPKRTIGLAWRKTSTRKKDFVALGHLIAEAQGARTGSNGEIRVSIA